jgi:hypothetical protein
MDVVMIHVRREWTEVILSIISLINPIHVHVIERSEFAEICLRIAQIMFYLKHIYGDIFEN